jgi:hypothetical protein
LLAIAVFAAASAPGSAAAHEVVPTPPAGSMTEVTGPAPPEVRTVAGGNTVALDEGLYRVAPAVGEPLLTHGPDDAAPPQTRASDLSPDGTGFVDGAETRQPVCATDFYQQVIYANVSGTPSRLAETTTRIREAIGHMDAVLNSESVASGGPGADYKMLCDSSGQVRVDALEVPGASFAQVVAAARAAGFSSDRASYLIFLDGELGGSCGIASYESDERLSLDNRNNSGGGYGLVYEPCWEGETAMHESAHMMGAVSYGAPHSTGTGGHCNEDADVMCYSPDGGDRNQGGMISNCPGVARFDCNFDDYFDTAPEPGEYLDSHWNLGSPLNRFISLAGVAAPNPGLGANPADDFNAGGKKQGASGERGDWRAFRVEVAPDSRFLRVRLFAAPGADLAVFVRRHKEPTRAVFSCRAVTKARHATCRLSDPAPGTWYVGVLTRGGRIGAGYKVSAHAQG